MQAEHSTVHATTFMQTGFNAHVQTTYIHLHRQDITATAQTGFMEQGITTLITTTDTEDN